MAERLDTVTTQDLILPFEIVFRLGVQRDGDGIPTGYVDSDSWIKLQIATAWGDHVINLWQGGAARSRINTLNKSDLSTSSLFKRLLEDLEVRGDQWNGAVVGSPD